MQRDENKCRNCHISGVPDSHHMLAQSGEYLCLNCHPVITNPDGSQSITMLRDCMQCHGTTFNSMNIPRPHHETQDAQDKHCSNCHGNIVDDYDDGHHSPYGPDFIRYCERCHAPKSLHNIQYDYVNTSTQPGYGHIGNDWNCKGCHAWYVAGGIAPGTDVIVPVITSLSTNKVLEGEITVLTIRGSNFAGIDQSSVIVLSDGINLITLTPSSITASEIVVPKVMIYSAEKNVEITNWSDTQIEVTSVDGVTGDIATVNSIYGTNFTEITEQGSVPTGKQKPKLNKKGD